MSEYWDYKPDLGKPSATADVDDLVETDDDSTEAADFDFDFEPADDDDEDADVSATDDSSDDGATPPPASEPSGANQNAAIAEQVLRMVGKDALIRVKGVEKPLSSFSPDEIVNWLQKSMRADQVFQEASAQRRQMEEERRKLEERSALLEKGAALVSDRLGFAQGGQGDQTGNVPDFLKPGQYDSEEVTALKQFSIQQQQRLERLEGNFTQRQQADKLRDIQGEIDRLSTDYPMAARDEVLAVKLGHPEVSTDELMRMAHEYYSSKDFIDKALKYNPTYKREYDAEVVKRYIAQKQSAKKIAGQPAAAKSSSSKVSDKGKKPIRDFEDATKAARAFYGESRRMASED